MKKSREWSLASSTIECTQRLLDSSTAASYGYDAEDNIWLRMACVIHMCPGLTFCRFDAKNCFASRYKKWPLSPKYQWQSTDYVPQDLCFQRLTDLSATKVSPLPIILSLGLFSPALWCGIREPRSRIFDFSQCHIHVPCSLITALDVWPWKGPPTRW